MKYERLLPFDDYRLRTLLSEAEVRDKVAGVLETGSQPFFSFRNYNTKPYKGKLTKEGFEIRRLITYRNSFLPLIQGLIVPSASGSTLHIRMRPHLYVLIFMSFWLGVVGLVCLGILFSLLTHWGIQAKRGSRCRCSFHSACLQWGMVCLSGATVPKAAAPKHFWQSC